jgi:large conductance mechanosensitive channel protein
MTEKTPKNVPDHTQDAKQARLDAREARREAAAVRAGLAKERAKTLAAKPAGHLHGFIEFIREKGVVGLAIGLAIGTAATGLVTQIVNAVITPTISLLIGQEGLDKLNWVVRYSKEGEPLVTYAIGDLIDALIKFLAIAALIYFVVLGLKLDKIDKKKE